MKIDDNTTIGELQDITAKPAYWFEDHLIKELKPLSIDIEVKDGKVISSRVWFYEHGRAFFKNTSEVFLSVNELRDEFYARSESLRIMADGMTVEPRPETIDEKANER